MNRPALLVLLLLAPSGLAIAQDPADPAFVGPIASDGGVEVQRISIERVRNAYAFKERVFSARLTLDLWAVYDGERLPEQAEERELAFLYRIRNLGPVLDNTGKLLSTKKRLARMPALAREVSPESSQRWGDKWGPCFSLTLDAPARQATKIERLRGDVEVVVVKPQTLTFPNVAGLAGKQLAHPSLVGLKLTPEVSKDKKEVHLRMTGEVGRLVSWQVKSGGRELSPLAREILFGVIVGQAFHEFLPDSLDLELTVLVPVQRRDFRFDMKDIELP